MKNSNYVNEHSNSKEDEKMRMNNNMVEEKMNVKGGDIMNKATVKSIKELKPIAEWNMSDEVKQFLMKYKAKPEMMLSVLRGTQIEFGLGDDGEYFFFEEPDWIDKVYWLRNRDYHDDYSKIADVIWSEILIALKEFLWSDDAVDDVFEDFRYIFLMFLFNSCIDNCNYRDEGFNKLYEESFDISKIINAKAVCLEELSNYLTFGQYQMAKYALIHGLSDCDFHQNKDRYTDEEYALYEKAYENILRPEFYELLFDAFIKK